MYTPLKYRNHDSEITSVKYKCQISSRTHFECINLSLGNISLKKFGNINGRNKSNVYDHESHCIFVERFNYQDVFKQDRVMMKVSHV